MEPKRESELDERGSDPNWTVPKSTFYERSAALFNVPMLSADSAVQRQQQQQAAHSASRSSLAGMGISSSDLVSCPGRRSRPL